MTVRRTMMLTVLAISSIQFNIVSKHLGSERMAFYLSEAAADIRDLMLTTMNIDAPAPKL